MATATKVRAKSRSADRSPGRPRQHEKWGPLAARSERSICIPVYLDSKEVLLLEGMARKIGMERATFGRVILRVASEVGLNGTIDMKDVVSKLRDHVEKWEAELNDFSNPIPTE